MKHLGLTARAAEALVYAADNTSESWRYRIIRRALLHGLGILEPRDYILGTGPGGRNA